MTDAEMGYRYRWLRGDEAGLAIEVRRRVYTEEFGFDLGGAGPLDKFDERAHHLLAVTSDDEPVASLRLLDGLARPFEIERFIDLSPFLPPDSHPAEITRLCILAPFRRITQASFIHLTLLEGVLRLAQRLRISHLVASTRDELMPMYKYLLFRQYSDVTYNHPEIGNARHTLMILELESFPARCLSERPTLYRAVEAASKDENSEI